MTWSSIGRGVALVILGTLIGLAVSWFVYVPAGRPDAAEVTLGLGVLTIGVAATLAWLLGSPRFASVRKVVFGVAVGSMIAFGLIFFTPLAETT